MMRLAIVWMLVLIGCRHNAEVSAGSCVSFDADGGVVSEPHAVDGRCHYFQTLPLDRLRFTGVDARGYYVGAPSGAFAWVPWGSELSSAKVTVVAPRHSMDCLRATTDGGDTFCALAAFRAME